MAGLTSSVEVSSDATSFRIVFDELSNDSMWAFAAVFLVTTMRYFDTSAFVKLFVDEPGSEEAARIWSRAQLSVSSRLLYPEARAALTATARAGRVSREGLPALREELEGLWRDVVRIEVTAPLAARAGDLAEGHGLRGYDAVHLASALEIDDDDTVLVTGDARLARTAHALGVTTARLPAHSSVG